MIKNLFYMLLIIHNFLFCTDKDYWHSTFINKVDKHVTFIFDLCKSNKLTKIIKSESNIKVLLDENMKFEHELVCLCHNKIKQKNKIEPLVETWQEYKEFKAVDNITFLKEFCTFILIIYKNFLIKVLPQASKNIPIAEIISIYKQSLNLPIEQLIEAIDLLHNKIIQIFENVENQPDLSLQQWIIKNWHIPFAILSGIITLIVNKIYNKNDYKKMI